MNIKKTGKFNDLNGVIKLAELTRNKVIYDSRCVVLISDRIKPRVCKIGYALRKKGYRVLFFLEKKQKANLTKADKECFDKICCFNSDNELYIRCLLIKPLIYHIFVEASVPKWAEMLIKNKNKLGKVVYDQYDVCRGLICYGTKEWIKREKYCLENADGLCCRCCETQYLKRKYKYKFSGKRILFWDYCWNKYGYEKSKVNPNEPLKLVYGGRIVLPASLGKYGEIEWEVIKFIADLCKEKNGKFYLIPSSECEKNKYGLFYRLAKNNTSFIFENSKQFEDLLEFENSMDYGLDCLEFNCKAELYDKAFGKNGDYLFKCRYYATNKYFDYIDAGIPVIYGRRNEIFGRFLSQYGVAVFCKVEDMPEKFEELKAKRNEYAGNIRKAREILSIENQIGRLINFYKDL